MEKLNPIIASLFVGFFTGILKSTTTIEYVGYSIAISVIILVFLYLNFWSLEEVKFDCTWVIKSPTNRIETINDTVVLKFYSLGKIKGKGSSGKGEYLIKGWLNKFTISLTFNGMDTHSKSLAGVVLLKLEPEYKYMNGVWAQLSTKSELLEGTVSFTKKY